MQKHLKRSILGSLASFGVAFVLISTAGAASAQEAPPSDSSSQDEATLGEPQYVERPAPRPDPANELGTAEAPADDPTPAAPAPTPAPAPAQPTPAPVNAAPAPAPRRPAATARPQAAPVPVAVQSAAPAQPAASTPARATEVQGVQVVRPAAPGDGTDAALAFTGTTDREVVLLVLAGMLLALGSALVRLSRSPRLA